MAVVEVHTTAIGESGVAMVEEVARLGNDGRSRARLRAQAIHGLCQELGVKDDFVIIDKHRDVAPQSAAGKKAQVANGSVAYKPDCAGKLGRQHVCILVAKSGGLEAVDNDDVRQTAGGGDVGHPMDGTLLDVGRGNDQDDDAAQAGDLLKRLEAVGKLGRRRIDGRGMVVAGDAARLAETHFVRPVARYDDGRIHEKLP